MGSLLCGFFRVGFDRVVLVLMIFNWLGFVRVKNWVDMLCIVCSSVGSMLCLIRWVNLMVWYVSCSSAVTCWFLVFFGLVRNGVRLMIGSVGLVFMGLSVLLGCVRVRVFGWVF